MYTLDAQRPGIPADDIEAMVRFVESRWTLGPDYRGIFQRIERLAAHDYRFMFDRFAVNQALRERLESREQLLDAEPNSRTASYYDRCCTILRDMSFQTDLLQEALYREASCKKGERWSFEYQANRVEAQVKADFVLVDAKPHGWAALRRGYTDFKGMRQYAETQAQRDEEQFDGADSASVGAPAFPQRIALVHVMYDEVCQGRSATNTLVGAAYGHFLRLHEHCNTRAVAEAIRTLSLPEAAEVTFDWELDSPNEVLGLLRKMIRDNGELPTATDYERAVESAQAFASKSPEEQAAIRTENQRQLREVVFSKRDDAAYEKEREDKILKVIELLQTLRTR